MLGMVTVRGLVVGLVDSGSLLHWDRARMLAKRSARKKNIRLRPLVQLVPAPLCHVGCSDRTAAVGMLRGLLGRLVSCLVGRILAADLQGKPGPRSPHLQCRHSPVLRLRLRATCACLGVAAGCCWAALSACYFAERLVALAGGRAPQCAPCSWEALLRELAARTRDRNRHEVLQYLVQGGKAAVRELSQATSRSH